MKTSLLSKWIGCVLSLTLANQVTAQMLLIRERGQDTRVFEQIINGKDGLGESFSITNQFTELANGLHYWNGENWQETEEIIEVFGNGAAARKGPHKVIFSPNINTAGAVDLETADGKRFQSQIFGLSYLDTSTGQSVLISELKDSFGELVSSNQVIYPDAFTDFEADVRFTYTKEGFEQDVILRQNPPSPDTYGLNPATTHLQVLTEFFDPPQPQGREGNNVTRQFLSENLTDERLDFGSMVIGKGRAFSLEEGEGTGLPSLREQGHPVGKQWDSLEGRDFLIESVEYQNLKTELEELPSAPPVEEARLNRPQRKLVQIIEQQTPKAAAKIEGNIKKLAQTSHRPGVVVDYVILNTASDFTLKGDTTYYVSGTVTLSGVTTVEGGTVVKYTNNAQIKIQGLLNCDTGPYRPAVFTSKDDNSVGDTISGSTGNPFNGYMANPALFLDNNISDLHDIRISHALEAVHYDIDSRTPQVLRHAQLVHCRRGIQPRVSRFVLQNVLMYDVLTNFYSTATTTGYGEHLTIHVSDRLNDNSGNITLNLTNSLFVSVTNFGGMQGAYNFTNTSSSGVLMTVGAGGHYLMPASGCQDQGTLAISGQLRKDLAKKTTEPPVVWGSTTLNVPTILEPTVRRDAGVPDIGYHYDPLDYAVSNTVVNSQVILTNGVAIAGYASSTYGFSLGNFGNFASEGRADKLNWLVRYNTVQEQFNSNWSASTVGSTLVDSGSGLYTRNIKSRFTGWSLLANEGRHLMTGYGFNTYIDFRDSQFFGGYLEMTGTPVGITNCLWVNVNLNSFDDSEDLVFRAYNSTFYRGYINLMRDGDSDWEFNDNIVIENGAFFWGDIEYTKNLFVGYPDPFPYDAVNNYQWGNFEFTSGPLGNYYHWTTNSINKGGGTAASRGLYHHTTRTEQSKDANTTVDIGFHYVAFTNHNVTTNIWHGERVTDNPPNATEVASTDGWNYVTSPVYHGTYAHQATLGSERQHYFISAATTLSVSEDDVLFAYAYLTTTNPPTSLMMHFTANDSTGIEHRAVWGGNHFGSYGVGTRTLLNKRPPINGWVRLEVPATALDLQGRTLNGLSYGHYLGIVTWDYMGKETRSGIYQGFDADLDGLPDYIEDSNGDGSYASGDMGDWGAFDTDGDGLADGYDPNPTAGTTPLGLPANLEICPE